MDLSAYIGYLKSDVLKIVEKENLEYKIVDLHEKVKFDTELFVKFENIDNILTLYFDGFILNI